ncbi:hypothetical protein EDD65_10794 [Keratinibaculum paraultunense]|uniref:Uncharacterized protein n=1 Tax=Keratinibaculum paraultunense TaxID=1278232 RepID=A0A4R3KTR7_9FIRM|nr:hypothetical protein EDD65_10794 [Keratinibaculum paraultunense]
MEIMFYELYKDCIKEESQKNIIKSKFKDNAIHISLIKYY